MAKIRRPKPPYGPRQRSGDISNVDANAPVTRKRKGPSTGRTLGTELAENVRKGVSTVNLDPLRYKPPKLSDRTQRAQDTMLAKSPRFLDALRNRLAGHHVGGSIKTVEDRKRFDELQSFKDVLNRQAIRATLAKKKAAVEQLKQATGVVKKGMAALKLFGLKFTGIIDQVKAAFDAIRPDKLKAQLRGLGLQPKKQMPRTVAGNTPYQSRNMIGVASSNVASIGWEPNNPADKVKRDTQGLLFIEFRNGWIYKYINAPHWLYEALMRSPSKGRAVWALIRRGLYPDGIPYGSTAREGYERIR